MHALFAFAYLILAFALGTALLGWILPDLKTWDALFTKRKPGGRPQWFRVYLATAVLV